MTKAQIQKIAQSSKLGYAYRTLRSGDIVLVHANGYEFFTLDGVLKIRTAASKATMFDDWKPSSNEKLAEKADALLGKNVKEAIEFKPIDTPKPAGLRHLVATARHLRENIKSLATALVELDLDDPQVDGVIDKLTRATQEYKAIL